jgi:hypothetical protein
MSNAPARKPLTGYDNKLKLSEIFNKEVNRALEDYPQLRGTFAFVNTVDNQVIADVDPVKSGVQSQQELNQHIDRMARESKKGGPVTSKTPYRNLSIIAYTPIPITLFSRKTDSPEREALAIFDHELGHLIVKGSIYANNPCYRECAADAFAVIRHYQRYGTKTDAVSILTWRRAFDFVISGNDEHFTTLAIEELDRLKDKVDFQKMSPEQIESLAKRIALTHTPLPQVTKEVSDAFIPVRRVLERTGDIERTLEKLAEVTLQNKDDYYVFKIGSAVLQSFLDGARKNMKGEPIILAGPFWDQVRAEMKEQSEHLAKNRILMGMPLWDGSAPPPVQPATPAAWQDPLWSSSSRSPSPERGYGMG